MDKQLQMVGELLEKTRNILERMNALDEKTGDSDETSKDDMRRDYEKLLETFEEIKRGQGNR